jgi:hypothetical protein
MTRMLRPVGRRTLLRSSRSLTWTPMVAACSGPPSPSVTPARRPASPVSPGRCRTPWREPRSAASPMQGGGIR